MLPGSLPRRLGCYGHVCCFKDILGQFRTLDRFCAKHGCLAAVRDYSAQHFLGEGLSGDYHVEAAAKMAEQEHPCECAAFSKTHQESSQGSSVSASQAYAKLVHEISVGFPRVAVWSFMEPSTTMEALHLAVGKIAIESEVPELKAAFEARLARWSEQHKEEHFMDAGNRLRDASPGFKMSLKCDCTHWCYEALVGEHGLPVLLRSISQLGPLLQP